MSRLTNLIESFDGRYNDNPFHNFEHASHVTMSVTKLLSRIVAPSDHEYNNEDGDDNLHDHTFGITSGAFGDIEA